MTVNPSAISTQVPMDALAIITRPGSRSAGEQTGSR
jgi:hypothetical protein